MSDTSAYETQQALDDVSQPDTTNLQPGPDDKFNGVAPPPVSESEKAAVKQWMARITAAKKHYKKAFDRMRDSQQLVKDGHDKDWPSDNYTVPIIKRHINTSVAALYAKNPTAVAKRRKQVQFKLWDGNYASLQEAMQKAQPQQDPTTGMMMPGDPNAMALLQEVTQVHNNNVLLDRSAKTMEILFAYYMGQQDAGYKSQLKAAVRRTKTCGVSWISLGFQRILQPNPEIAQDIADVTDKIATMQRLIEDYQDGDVPVDSAEMDQLQTLLADLQAAPDLIVREGPVLGFPHAQRVIVDTKCSHLKTLAGAEWVAEQFPPMSRDRVKEVFQVDIGTNFNAYTPDKKNQDAVEALNETLAVLYRVQHKKTRQTFVICDGYEGYVVRPAEPDVKVSRFWTLFPIIFSEVDDEEDIYTSSDAWDARHMQREYNSVRQALREHRIQNRPKYAVIKGLMDKEDMDKIANAQSGSVLQLNALTAGQKVEDVLQAVKQIAIDPNLYEVNSIQGDVEKSIGSSSADLGAPASASATQSSITENGRSTMNAADVDDLDECLSALATAMGEVMLLELDEQTVIKIAGPGAAWPTTKPSREDIAEQLQLEIKAGSSGRPNLGADLANMERGLPYLLQLPGVNPYPLGRRYGDLLNLDVEDIVIEGMPSITAMNAQAGHAPTPPMAGNPAAAPAAQGGAGANNTPNPQVNEPGPQAAHPAPAPNGSLINPGLRGSETQPVPQPRYVAEKIPIGPQGTGHV